MKDETGESILHWAALNGDVTAAKWLLEIGVERDAQADNLQTPLYFLDLCRLCGGSDCEVVVSDSEMRTNSSLFQVLTMSSRTSERDTLVSCRNVSVCIRPA